MFGLKFNSINFRKSTSVILNEQNNLPFSGFPEMENISHETKEEQPAA